MKVGLILCKCFITHPNSVSIRTKIHQDKNSAATVYKRGLITNEKNNNKTKTIYAD